ncbi:hypothetical protein [Paraferrimonas sp. SM1919]|uniref:hypothetical protein n=1 Tax=Paraferrimonas sp. SM1919 TaxID=2662263 RepID=UPI0013D1B530|nr:hypothetical protein [Paraferrimonas sp. SM1919]
MELLAVNQAIERELTLLSKLDLTDIEQSDVCLSTIANKINLRDKLLQQLPLSELQAEQQFALTTKFIEQIQQLQLHRTKQIQQQQLGNKKIQQYKNNK